MKYVNLIVVLSLLTILSACGGGGGSSTEPGDTELGGEFTDATASIDGRPRLLQLGWSFDGETDHFIVEVNVDGASGFTQLDLNGDGILDDSDILADDALSVELAIPLHLTDFDRIKYRIVARDDNTDELAVSAERDLLNVIVNDMIGYVKASNTESIDVFGGAIALSTDGTTLVVGASGEDSDAIGVSGDEVNNDALSAGAVYVFKRDGAGDWSQQAYIKASNTESSDFFGAEAALSANGNILAVGARGEDSDATGVDGDELNNDALSAGAVYLFEQDQNGNWTQQAYLKASNTEAGDGFGHKVALSGDGKTLAVTARHEASIATGVDGNESDNTAADAGAVYVFNQDNMGEWTQQAYIKPSNTKNALWFGESGPALSHDGSVLAIGARNDDSDATGIDGDDSNSNAVFSGAVHVYTRDMSGVWSQQAYIKASNTAAVDQFGGNFVTLSNVDLSGDGNTLAVGAVAEDGGIAGVGGDQTDNSTGQSGAVYVFTRDLVGDWSQQAYIKASNPEQDDFFGSVLSLSATGDVLAVTAIDEDSAATGINGDDSDNTFLADPRTGAVYVFTRDSTDQWSQQAYVKAPNMDATDWFGRSVALSGDGSTLAIAADAEDSAATGIGGDQDDNTASAAGAVYLY